MSRPGALALSGIATDVDVIALRRAALCILLASKLTAGWGLGWTSAGTADRPRLVLDRAARPHLRVGAVAVIVCSA